MSTKDKEKKPTTGSMIDTKNQQPTQASQDLKQASSAANTTAIKPKTPYKSKPVNNDAGPSGIFNPNALIHGTPTTPGGPNRSLAQMSIEASDAIVGAITPNDTPGGISLANHVSDKNGLVFGGDYKEGDVNPEKQNWGAGFDPDYYPNPQAEAAIPAPQAAVAAGQEEAAGEAVPSRFSTEATLPQDQLETANALKLFGSQFPGADKPKTRQREVFAPAYAALQTASKDVRKAKLEEEAMLYLRDTMDADDYALLASGLGGKGGKSGDSAIPKFKEQFQVVSTKQDDGFGGTIEDQQVLTQDANGAMIAVPLSDFSARLPNQRKSAPPTPERIQQTVEGIKSVRGRYSEEEWKTERDRLSKLFQAKGLKLEDYDL